MRIVLLNTVSILLLLVVFSTTTVVIEGLKSESTNKQGRRRTQVDFVLRKDSRLPKKGQYIIPDGIHDRNTFIESSFSVQDDNSRGGASMFFGRDDGDDKDEGGQDGSIFIGRNEQHEGFINVEQDEPDQGSPTFFPANDDNVFGEWGTVPSDVPSTAPSDHASDVPSPIPVWEQNEFSTTQRPNRVWGVASSIGNGDFGAFRLGSGTSSVVPTVLASSSPSMSPAPVPATDREGNNNEIPVTVTVDITISHNSVPNENDVDNTTDGGDDMLPSDGLSAVPSDVPSGKPSDMPSDMPSGAPSDFPSIAPSDAPSQAPTLMQQQNDADEEDGIIMQNQVSNPTDAPQLDEGGTNASPSEIESPAPGSSVTAMISDRPSDAPSMGPTDATTDAPTNSPTARHTEEVVHDVPEVPVPTNAPSSMPSFDYLAANGDGGFLQCDREASYADTELTDLLVEFWYEMEVETIFNQVEQANPLIAEVEEELFKVTYRESCSANSGNRRRLRNSRRLQNSGVVSVSPIPQDFLIGKSFFNLLANFVDGLSNILPP